MEDVRLDKMSDTCYVKLLDGKVIRKSCNHEEGFIQAPFHVGIGYGFNGVGWIPPLSMHKWDDNSKVMVIDVENIITEIRPFRNRLLKESDGMLRSDRSFDEQEVFEYSQYLRDIPDKLRNGEIDTFNLTPDNITQIFPPKPQQNN